MNYRSLKWQKIKFILTPDELRNVLTDIKWFIAEKCAPIEESNQINDKESIFFNYSLFYKKVISGEVWQGHENELNIYTRITNDINLASPESIGLEANKKKRIQQLPIQAVINLSPFSLQLKQNKRLSVAYFDSSSNSNIGLELSYPEKVIDTVSKEVICTSNFATSNLYHELVDSIKSYCEHAQVMYNEQILFPDFWVSPKCVNDLNYNYMMKANNLEFI